MRRFDYQDINLIPRLCIVNSRSECDTRVKLGSHVFNMPVVPANMECVINSEIAIKLSMAGYFYIYHRFNTDILNFALAMKNLGLLLSISVGVNQDDYETLTILKNESCVPDFITIDIAHGHSLKMQAMIKWIAENLPTVFIIAGNVSTAEASKDLESWGAHAIKVGIGPGSACTTYNATGFGSRHIQASVIQECASAVTTAQIIADGGIKDPGDIAKSLVLGADMVMVGGMFSALTDSPGSTVRGSDGQLYKEFWGSASAFQNGKSNRIEGTKKLLPLKNNDTIQEMTYLKECLQSAISYGGGNNLLVFNDVKYV
jgi:GMP reductase